MDFIQNRWKLEGKSLIYYGLRNKENLFNNELKLNKKQREIVRSLPAKLTSKEVSILDHLIDEQIVLEKDLLKTPKSLEEARFCKTCVANDYIIPGIEFDSKGLCPMCQTKEDVKDLKSVVPIKNIIPKQEKSRFDVGLFYTGGKDSTYLLYYLAKQLDLKVLAMTWEIPFMSKSAKQSIANAKKKLDNVEFVSKKINDKDLRKIYQKLYSLSENTCACPSLAYILFYPELVENNVPYFVAGNKPVQFQTLLTMKQLAYGDSALKKISGYKNPLLENINTAIGEVPSITKPLKKSIRRSSWTGNIPAFIHIDLNEISGGTYNWMEVKDIIEKECGWVGPEDTGKGLHTSCKIEKCKEYSQFQRFYHMRSQMIPFSALEISLASNNKNITRDEAIYEIKETLGFSLEKISECRIMEEYLKGD